MNIFKNIKKNGMVAGNKKDLKKNKKKIKGSNKFKGIKTQLITKYVSLILGLSLMLSTTALVFTKISLVRNSETLLLGQVQQAASNVNVTLREYVTMAEMLSQDERISNPDIPKEEKLRILKGNQDKYGHFKIGIADAQGAFKSADDRLDVVSDKYYFQQAMEGKSCISQPFWSTSRTELQVAFSAPIISKGEVTSVLVIIRDGSEFSNITNEIKFGKTGSAFMLDAEGNTIAHQNAEYVKNQSNMIFKAEEDPALEEISTVHKDMIAGNSDIDSYTFQGVKKIIVYGPIPGTNWSLGITTEESDMLSGMNNQIIAIVVATIIISFAKIPFVSINTVTFLVEAYSPRIRRLFLTKFISILSNGEGPLSPSTLINGILN